jgi:hypothetical protein
MALQTCKSEIGTRDKNSEDCERGDSSEGNCYYRRIENA